MSSRAVSAIPLPPHDHPLSIHAPQPVLNHLQNLTKHITPLRALLRVERLPVHQRVVQQRLQHGHDQIAIASHAANRQLARRPEHALHAAHAERVDEVRRQTERYALARQRHKSRLLLESAKWSPFQTSSRSQCGTRRRFAGSECCRCDGRPDRSRAVKGPQELDHKDMYPVMHHTAVVCVNSSRALSQSPEDG